METLVGFCGVLLLIQRCATLHVGLPPEDWNTGSRVCSFASLNDVQDPKKLSPINGTLPQKYNLTWTGRRVKHSRWTAFIGCSTSFTTDNQEEKTTGSLDECVSYCSQLNTKYLAYKDMKCACFDSVNRIDENLKDCRQQCNDGSEDFACSGGSSTMIFEFVDSVVQESSFNGTKYIPNECIAEANKNPGQYKIMDCASANGIVCSSSANSPSGFNWFGYQNECLERGNHILYGKNFSDVKKNVNFDYYWTPIFRTQVILEDQKVSCDTCQCIAVNMDGSFESQNCSQKLPFLCKQACDGTQEKNGDEDSPRVIKLSIFVVIGVCVFVIILLLVITILCMKIQKVKTKLQVTAPTFETTRRDNYPPPSKSPSANKARLRETYIDTCDTPLRLGGYHDVYDDVNKGFKIKG